MKKALNYLLIFAVSLIVYIVIAPIRGQVYGDMGEINPLTVTSISYFILYFVLTVLFLKTYKDNLKPWGIILALFLGATHIELFVRFRSIENFYDTIAGLPEFIFRLLAIGLGWVFFKMQSKPAKGIMLICSLLICLWVTIPGYRYYFHYLDYGNLTGRVAKKEVIKEPIYFEEPSGEKLSLEDLKGKYVILYFCYSFDEYLPLIQKAYNRNKYKEGVLLYNIYIDNNKGYTIDKVVDRWTKMGYTFPSLSTTNDNSPLQAIGIKLQGAYTPTVLVIDKEGYIIYRSSIENFEGKSKHGL